jgi:hypothetical protein
MTIIGKTYQKEFWTLAPIELLKEENKCCRGVNLSKHRRWPAGRYS